MSMARIPERKNASSFLAKNYQLRYHTSAFRTDRTDWPGLCTAHGGQQSYSCIRITIIDHELKGLDNLSVCFSLQHASKKRSKVLIRFPLLRMTERFRPGHRQVHRHENSFPFNGFEPSLRLKLVITATTVPGLVSVKRPGPG